MTLSAPPPPPQAEAFGLLKRLRLDRIFTPRAPRHKEWRSLDEARRHFQTRLKRFDHDCLEDFVVSGGVGVSLICSQGGGGGWF